MLHFTIQELNPHNYPLTPEIEASLNDLIAKVSLIREAYGLPMTVSSGLRSQADQQRINPSAPKSAHLVGMAVDIADADGKLKEWLKANLHILEQVDLYCESFDSTPSWTHFQTRKTKSGNRVFIP